MKNTKIISYEKAEKAVARIVSLKEKVEASEREIETLKQELGAFMIAHDIKCLHTGEVCAMQKTAHSKEIIDRDLLEELSTPEARSIARRYSYDMDILLSLATPEAKQAAQKISYDANVLLSFATPEIKKVATHTIVQTKSYLCVCRTTPRRSKPYAHNHMNA